MSYFRTEILNAVLLQLKYVRPKFGKADFWLHLIMFGKVKSGHLAKQQQQTPAGLVLRI